MSTHKLHYRVYGSCHEDFHDKHYQYMAMLTAHDEPVTLAVRKKDIRALFAGITDKASYRHLADRAFTLITRNVENGIYSGYVSIELHREKGD